MTKGNLHTAIQAAGSCPKLAKMITARTGKYVSHQAVQQWKEKGIVPLGRAIDVMTATGITVFKQQIAPGFYLEIKQGDCMESNPNDKEVNTNSGDGSSAGCTSRDAAKTGAEPETINKHAA